jgi:pimeloyl-ACP methyl ester carboxylesterase
MPTAPAHDGSETYFEAHGTGPALLAFVPARPPRGPLGAPSRALKSRLLAELGDRYRLVFFDYPRPSKPLTLTPANVTQDLLAVADATGADHFAWYGYSWGAVIGYQLAATTDRVSALVTGGFPPLGGPYEQMLRLARGYAGKAERLHLPRKVQAGFQQWVTYYEGMQTYDDRDAQERFTMPRLAFAGSEDHVKLSGERIASLGGTLAQHRDELVALGWEVDVRDGLNHRTAANPDIVVPQLGAFLGRARGQLSPDS